VARLGENRYGKARVRLSRITRKGDTHEFNEWTVRVLLHGYIEATIER
jgi:urate oxidase